MTPATAADLDAMTPHERAAHFAASIVDPATLTPEQRAAVVQRATPAGTELERHATTQVSADRS